MWLNKHGLLLQTGEAEEELKGTLKRIQRLVKVKKGSGSEEGKTASDSSGG